MAHKGEERKKALLLIIFFNFLCVFRAVIKENKKSNYITHGALDIGRTAWLNAIAPRIREIQLANLGVGLIKRTPERPTRDSRTPSDA